MGEPWKELHLGLSKSAVILENLRAHLPSKAETWDLGEGAKVLGSEIIGMLNSFTTEYNGERK